MIQWPHSRRLHPLGRTYSSSSSSSSSASVKYSNSFGIDASWSPSPSSSIAVSTPAAAAAPLPLPAAAAAICAARPSTPLALRRNSSFRLFRSARPWLSRSACESRDCVWRGVRLAPLPPALPPTTGARSVVIFFSFSSMSVLASSGCESWSRRGPPVGCR
jgi:hypothetical protein